MQNTNTHMVKIRPFMLNIHTEPPPRMDSLLSSYGNCSFSYFNPMKYDTEISLANRAISDIRPGFKLKPQKNQHFPVTILTVIRNFLDSGFLYFQHNIITNKQYILTKNIHDVPIISAMFRATVPRTRSYWTHTEMTEQLIWYISTKIFATLQYIV